MATEVVFYERMGLARNIVIDTLMVLEIVVERTTLPHNPKVVGPRDRTKKPTNTSLSRIVDLSRCS
jgi:hypothetical protein